MRLDVLLPAQAQFWMESELSALQQVARMERETLQRLAKEKQGARHHAHHHHHHHHNAAVWVPAPAASRHGQWGPRQHASIVSCTGLETRRRLLCLA